MRSKILFIAIIALLELAIMSDKCHANNNWRGTLDTAKIHDVLGEDSLIYTSWLWLGKGENLRIICKADKKGDAGFASDSLEFDWGFQVGTIVRDSAGNLDTLADMKRIKLDAFSTDSLGKGPYEKTQDTLYTYGNQNLGVDTSSVSNWAVQNLLAIPEWSPLIRFWVMGNTDITADTLDIEFELHQREGLVVKKP